MFSVAMHVDGTLEVSKEELDLNAEENMEEAKSLKYFNSYNVNALKPSSRQYFFDIEQVCSCRKGLI